MPHQLAFMTFGVLKAEFGQLQVQGFVDAVPGVYDHASNSPGFIARSERQLEGKFGHSWGPICMPKCWGVVEPLTAAATLSLWEDIESVAAFAYHGNHGASLKRRSEWFIEADQPNHVAWWTDQLPPLSWQEAADRMDHLHEFGSSANAFSLRQPFDCSGNPTKVNAEAVRARRAETTS